MILYHQLFMLGTTERSSQPSLVECLQCHCVQCPVLRGALMLVLQGAHGLAVGCVSQSVARV